MKCTVMAYGINGEEDKQLSVEVSDYDYETGLPILDLPMMSDERWDELCVKNTMDNYRALSGMGEAPDYETALAWEKEYFGVGV